MVEANLIGQGWELMAYGMGTVGVFLTVLVVLTTLMSKVITRFFPESPVVETRQAAAATATSSSTPVDPKILVAIQEAIYQHRAKTK